MLGETLGWQMAHRLVVQVEAGLAELLVVLEAELPAQPEECSLLNDAVAQASGQVD